MFGYHVPRPDQAMLISGGKQRAGAADQLALPGPDGSTASSPMLFRIVTGHGAFAVPIVRKVSFLTLAMREALVNEECVSQQGIALRVRAVIAFKVGSDFPSIAAAAQRFLDNQDQMDELTGQIFAGHLRSIVGSMTVEAIIRERQTLASNVLEASGVEMGNLGLVVDSLQIQSIDDLGIGYITALSAPYQAQVQQAAQIAQAKADQAAAEAQQQSARARAEYERQTAVARAQYQSEIDTAQQRGQQAGPLAAAQAQQEVLREQALVAERQAELREAQLQSEVVKPAQAEAERVRISAQAQAEATRLSAEAASAEGRIALDQALIAQLPELVRAAAGGLSSANLTVLNGSDGLSELAAGLASQGGQIWRSLRATVADEPRPAESRPSEPRPAESRSPGSRPA